MPSVSQVITDKLNAAKAEFESVKADVAGKVAAAEAKVAELEADAKVLETKIENIAERDISEVKAFFAVIAKHL